MSETATTEEVLPKGVWRSEFDRDFYFVRDKERGLTISFTYSDTFDDEEGHHYEVIPTKVFDEELYCEMEQEDLVLDGGFYTIPELNDMVKEVLGDTEYLDRLREMA